MLTHSYAILKNNVHINMQKNCFKKIRNKKSSVKQVIIESAINSKSIHRTNIHRNITFNSVAQDEENNKASRILCRQKLNEYQSRFGCTLTFCYTVTF